MLSLVLAVGGLIRAVLPLVPGLTSTLASTIEVSTPVNSFKALHEAFYYINHNIALYDGGVVHHPPLVVVFFAYLNAIPYASIIFNLLWTAADVGMAYKLVQINRWYHQRHSKAAPLVVFDDHLIAAFVLFNPLLLATNLAHSTLSLALFLVVESLEQLVIEHLVPRAVMALTVAAYINFSHIYLMVPLFALAHAVYGPKVYKKGLAVFVTSVVALFGASYAITNSTNFLSCYTTVINFKKITPNLGLWWYLFTEMFDFFTPFYIGLFNTYSVLFIVPLAIRLFETQSGDSLLAFVMAATWISFTKSYPTVGDLGFVLALLPIFRGTVIPHCKFVPITLLTLLIALLLSPIFYYCWIVLGNGNSNFFYSINLIWGVVHVLVLADFIWGRLTYDYINFHGLSKEKAAKLRLTQL